ncbi:unnamed protein product, partial [Ectocarpus sp. 13 AM-2016]
LLARKIPGYVYDHPGLAEEQSTAFATSHGVFFNAEFLKKLAEEDLAAKRANEKADSTIPLVLHELKHIYYRHHDRFTKLARREPDLVGIGTDIRINQDIEQLQNNARRSLGKVFYEVGVGLSEEEKTLFSDASEDRIIQSLIAMRDKRRDEQNNQKSQPGGQPQEGGSPGKQGGSAGDHDHAPDRDKRSKEAGEEEQNNSGNDPG